MREVTGRIVRPDGSPVAYSRVTFWMTDRFGRIVNAYDSRSRIASAARTTTDGDGRFSISVVENDKTQKPTAYLVRVDDRDVRDCTVVVQGGDGAIDWVDLLRYGRLITADFDGSIYRSYPTIDGIGYRFDCEMAERVIDFIGGGRNEETGSPVPEFAEFFIAHVDGVWQRGDTAAFDRLLTAMVERDASCETIEAEG